MGRTSTSSDVSSTLSEATTAYSYSKDIKEPKDGKEGSDLVVPGTDTTTAAVASTTTSTEASHKPEKKSRRRALRQKARNVLSDMGAPPTRRQDAKEGKQTQNYADLGMLGASVQVKPSQI